MNIRYLIPVLLVGCWPLTACSDTTEPTPSAAVSIGDWQPQPPSQLLAKG